MSNKVSGGGVIQRTKRVFLRSGTANEGYAVCYNWDAVGVTAENETLTTAPYGRPVGTAITDWCDARRLMVEAPSYDNNLHFAGVVDAASDGVVGPNWISIHTPGSVCKVYCAVTIDPRDGTTTTKNSYELLNFGICTNSVGVAGSTAPYINGQFRTGGQPGAGAAVALEAETSGSALVQAELCEGPPSGGVQVIAMTTTLTGATVINHGEVVITSLAAAAGVASIAVQDGRFSGQRAIFRVSANPTNTVKISFTGATPNLSAEYLTAAPLVAATAASLDAADEFLDIEWNGVKWVVQGANVKVT